MGRLFYIYSGGDGMKEIEIDDDEMALLGKKIRYDLYLYDDKLLRMIRTHQTKNVSYYVEEKNRG